MLCRLHVIGKKEKYTVNRGVDPRAKGSALDSCFIQKRQHYFALSWYWALAGSSRRMGARTQRTINPAEVKMGSQDWLSLPAFLPTKLSHILSNSDCIGI